MRKILILAALAIGVPAAAGCSLKSMAMNSVADALSSTGDVFSGDDDPELIRDAVPFGLKTYESILAEVPEHRGLQVATASGFAQYAYAFVVLEAERIEDRDLARSRELRRRARRLFLRGRDYAMKGLEAAHPGFEQKLRKDSAAALAETEKDDATLLYWAGASWGGALMASKDDLNLVAELPLAGALVGRVLELDDSFGSGAAHEFMISYEGARSEAMGGSPKRAREHYRRALEISKGKRASVHLALAETVSVRDQNYPEFMTLVDAALAVDPEKDPSQRLTNVLSQRRALLLKTRVSDLFLDVPPGEEKKK
jgi:predicted anti-sigma-YlaC factor YlaD